MNSSQSPPPPAAAPRSACRPASSRPWIAPPRPSSCRIFLAGRTGRMDRNRQHARHRAETKSDDEDQRKHDAGHGAAEFHETLDNEAQPGLRRSIFSGEKVKRESKNRTEQCSDIANQHRLTQIER